MTTTKPTTVDGAFDIFSLATDGRYAVHADRAGNLWFARTIENDPKKWGNVGAEVYKFDGESPTRFVFDGTVLDGDDLDFRTHMTESDDCPSSAPRCNANACTS